MMSVRAFPGFACSILSERMVTSLGLGVQHTSVTFIIAYCSLIAVGVVDVVMLRNNRGAIDNQGRLHHGNISSSSRLMCGQNKNVKKRGHACRSPPTMVSIYIP
jgi:hypothetical protein